MRIICWFAGHVPVEIVMLSGNALKFKCSRCRRTYAYYRPMDAVLPWSKGLEKLYDRSVEKVEFIPSVW
jgi:hypothetical protein